MDNVPGTDTISVLYEYRPQTEMTVAYFEWKFEQPKDTVNLAIGFASTLIVDGHIPVRPKSIYIPDGELQHLEDLENLFGRPFTEAIKDTSRAANIGMSALEITLDPGQRLDIARLQRDSPEIPVPLRKACAQMVLQLSKSIF